MEMNLYLPRQPTHLEVTLGDLFIEKEHFCKTLEDAIREIPGRPVKEWKVYGKTAIKQGKYRLTMEDSPHFGPDTITINGVEDYDDIRMHGGNTILQTLGCVIVGSRTNLTEMTISGAVTDRVLEKLKARIKPVLVAGGDVFITITNP